MRNLKRALSLALASVMLLGMMVAGTSAASYPDIDENDNVEAIEVLNAVNVMIGRQGNFEPDEAVNRHEMAVIMAKLVLGVDTADNYVGSHPFTDVVPWADKYVAACYENGLVAGTSATTYGGTQPLSAVQAAAMMLRALGYKDLSVGATDWRAPVTAMANQIRLFDGVASNPSEQLNRNQVAQLALNTLKSPMVNLKDNTISWTNGDGQIIMTGGSREYIVLSSREAYAQAINRVESEGTSASAIAGYTVELGEHLYNGKLRLNDDTDVFLRPARTWEYDGKKIGTYVKEELLRATYSTEVTGKTLYDLLSKNTISKYDFTIAIDGVDTDEVTTMTGYFTKGNLVSTNTRGVGATGKGVTTEVYVDSVNEQVTIAVINTYLAKAAEKYNEKRDEVKFNVWGLEQKSSPKFLNKETSKNPAKTFSLTVSGEDFDVKDVAKSDIVLVRVADNAIQEIIQPEVIDKTTLSSFSKGSWVNNGTKYEYANTARYDDKVLDYYSKPNMKELTYNLYLDGYGYMIGIERNEDPDQYVFLAGIDAGDSNLKASTADANVIHVDGTMKTVKVDMNKSDLPRYMSGDVNNSQLNTWCTYSVSTSGVYTLEEVTYNAGANAKDTDGSAIAGQFAQDVADYHDTGKTNKTITEKRTSLVASTKANGDVDTWVYGNDDTKYINVELNGVVVKDNVNGSVPAGATGKDYRRIIDDVDVVITGIKDVDLEMTDLPVVKQNDKGTAYYINPEAEIYTLYKEGIVIAAVTVGEDNGSAATWAYITSTEPRQEDYYHESSSKAAEPGEWTWYREAIVNGKIVDLVEVGDSLTYIGNKSKEGNMQQGEWWEIKVNADGNVRKSTLLSKVLGNRFQTESWNVEQTVNTESGDVVLHMNFIRENYKKNVDTLTFKNGNLYTNSDLTKGFSVSRDVEVVLGQAQLNSGYDNGDGENDWGDHGRVDENNRNKYVKQWKYKDDTYEGYDGLKSVLDRLDANFVGDLSVIFHNGAATVIVINDIWGEYIDEGEYIGNKNNVSGDASIRWIGGDDWTLTVPADVDIAKLGIKEIADYMAKAGCTEIVHTRYGWSFTKDGYRNEDQNVELKNAETTTYKLTVDKATNGTVNYDKDGNKVTLKIKADGGYELKTLTVGGKDVTSDVKADGTYTFTMTKDTTVTATFKSTTVVGTPVTVTFDGRGSAAAKAYTVAGLADGKVEMKSGEKLTITANADIYVHVNGGTAKEVLDGDKFETVIDADTTILINKAGYLSSGDNVLSYGEVWRNGVTPFGAMAVIGRMSFARAADNFVKIRFALANGAYTETYTVKLLSGGTVRNGPWQFGKGVNMAALVDGLNDSLDEGTTPRAQENGTVTQDDIDAWNGTGTTDPDSPGTGKVWLTVNFPAGVGVKLDPTADGATFKDAASGVKVAVPANKNVTLRVTALRSTQITAVTGATKGADAAGYATYTVNSDKDATVTITAQTVTAKTLTITEGTSATVTANTGVKAARVGLVANGEILSDENNDPSNTKVHVYTVYPGEKVSVAGTSITSYTSGTETVELDSVNRTEKVLVDATAATALSFVMPNDDFAMILTAANKPTDGVGNGGTAISGTITAHDGVTATWTSADGKTTRTIAGDKPVGVPADGKLTITSTGTGTSVIATAATKFATKAYTTSSAAFSAAGVTDLYPAVAVKLIGTQATAQNATPATVVTGTKTGATAYVAVGEKLTFSSTAANKPSFVADSLTGTALKDGKLTVGSADTTVYAAYKVTVGENVTAVYGSTTVVGGADKVLYVPAGEKITVSNKTTNAAVAVMGAVGTPASWVPSPNKAITELTVDNNAILGEVIKVTFIGTGVGAKWSTQKIGLSDSYDGMSWLFNPATGGNRNGEAYAKTGTWVVAQDPGQTYLQLKVTGAEYVTGDYKAIFQVGSSPIIVEPVAEHKTSITVKTEAELRQAITDKYGEIILGDVNTGTMTLGAALEVPAGTTIDLGTNTLSAAGYAVTLADGAKIIADNGKLTTAAGAITGGKGISGNIEFTGAGFIDKLSSTANVTIKTAAQTLTADFEIPAGAKVTLDGQDLTVNGATLTVNGTLDTKTNTVIIATAAGKIKGGENITGAIKLNVANAEIDNVSDKATLTVDTGLGIITGNAAPKTLTITAGGLTVEANATLTLPGTVAVTAGNITVRRSGKLDLNGYDLTLAANLTVEDTGKVVNGTVKTKSSGTHVITGAADVEANINVVTSTTSASIDGLSKTSTLTVAAPLTITGNVTFGAENVLTWTAGNITIDAAGKTVALNGALNAPAANKITVTAGTLKLGGDLTITVAGGVTLTDATSILDLSGYMVKGTAATTTIVAPAGSVIKGLTTGNNNFYKTAATGGNFSTTGTITGTATATPFTWNPTDADSVATGAQIGWNAKADA